MSTRPNIVFIMPDQQRADMLGSAGDSVAKTPNTDRLAREGVQFNNTYAQGPLCMPARASLLTERYVRDHGVFQNQSVVDPTIPTFAQSLQQAGYLTSVIGKTHWWIHIPKRYNHAQEAEGLLNTYGFEEVHETVGKEATLLNDTVYTDFLQSRGLLNDYRSYLKSRQKHTGSAAAKNFKSWHSEPIPLPLDAYQDAWLGDYTADWIEKYNDDRPFFLQVGFPGPHDPWDAPQEALDLFGDGEIPLPASLKRPEVPESGPLATFLNNFLKYCDSSTMTDEAIHKVRRAYYANMMVIDRSIGKIVDALERKGILDNTWVIYTSDHGEMMGEHRMLKKMVFYDPAVKIPLIVRPPGGISFNQVYALVEQIDISATIRDIAGADLPTSNARSLLPFFNGSGPSLFRDVVISESYGMAMFKTDRYKLLVYEDDVLPVQLFDQEKDPLEDRNVVDDPDYAEVVKELMETHVRPFLAIRPLRPHRSIVERGSLKKDKFYLP